MRTLKIYKKGEYTTSIVKENGHAFAKIIRKVPLTKYKEELTAEKLVNML